MPAPTTLFHAFLRPSIIKILRATGYHSTSPAVLDCITDVAARYLSLLCEKTAANAVHNYGDAGDFTIVEARMALEEAGALLPQRVPSEQLWLGEEDLRGVDEFVAWFSSQRMKELTEFAKADDDMDETDYLSALKKRHNKTSDDAKFQGTILGKPNELGEGEMEVEGGGDIKSIEDWISQRTSRSSPHANGISSSNAGGTGEGMDGVRRTRSPSSGLSSVGSRLAAEDREEMDLT